MDAISGAVDQAFVAYSSRDSHLAEIIALGVSKANRRVGKRIQYAPWVFNDIAGNPQFRRSSMGSSRPSM